jgi:hypothetical protein
MLKDIKDKASTVIKAELEEKAEMGVEIVKSGASGFINMILRKIFFFFAAVVIFIAVIYVGSSYLTNAISNDAPQVQVQAQIE